MRFCDACEKSIPKNAKTIHTRHGKWLCAPCHDLEVAELKERAEAHLRERQEHPRSNRSTTTWTVVGVSLIAIVGVAFFMHDQNADAMSADEAQAAYLSWRHDAELKEMRSLTDNARTEREQALRTQRAEAAKVASNDPTFQSFERMVRQELKLQVSYVENPCAILEADALSILVNPSWHALDGEEQLEFTETVDRVVTAVFKGARDWSFKDGPFSVGGRRSDSLWASRADYDASRS